MKLSKRECKPCKGGVPPLQGEALLKLADELGNSWRVVGSHHLEKDFEFKDFKEALAFTNRVGELAESVSHHPDILLTYGKVKIYLWTHKIDGLVEADFIFAAKIDEILTH